MTSELTKEQLKNIAHATKYWDSYPLTNVARQKQPVKEFAVYYDSDTEYEKYLDVLSGGKEKGDGFMPIILMHTIEEAKKVAFDFCVCIRASAIVYNRVTKELIARLSSEAKPFSKQVENKE